LKYLWSPWRMEYIEEDNKDDECVFCNAPGWSDFREHLIVYRGERTYLILNRYPYTSGHLMVVPYEHISSLELLDSKTRAEMMELTSKAIQVIQDTYQPQGFNVGINIGEAAGAGIVDHVHLHIVPRWAGDTNFMTSLSHTRVLPESLEDTYQRVLSGWLKLEEKNKKNKK
jgi:ATP adenylyltransferase